MKKLLLLLSAIGLSTVAFSQCQAYFTSSINGGTVDFTDASTGSNLGYSWSFGDGNSSSLSSPSHTYSNTGTYVVCLTVYSMDSLSQCQDSYCDSIYVVADSTVGGGGGSNGCSVSANVYHDGNGSIVGTNTSSGAAYYMWDVYDNGWMWIHSSSSANLNYNPGANGNYNVCLTSYDSMQVVCDTACYYVSIMDSNGSGGSGSTGCDASANVTGNQNGTITGTATSSGATSFYWSVFNSNGNFIHDDTSNPMSYNPGTPGVYTVCLTTYDSLQNLCDSMCYQVATDSTAGFNKMSEDLFMVYPNPAQDLITISTSSDLVKDIILADVSGTIVSTQAVASEKTQINLDQFPKGLYFVHAIGKEGQRLSSCKIIKR